MGAHGSEKKNKSGKVHAQIYLAVARGVLIKRIAFEAYIMYIASNPVDVAVQNREYQKCENNDSHADDITGVQKAQYAPSFRKIKNSLGGYAN